MQPFPWRHKQTARGPGGPELTFQIVAPTRSGSRPRPSRRGAAASWCATPRSPDSSDTPQSTASSGLTSLQWKLACLGIYVRHGNWLYVKMYVCIDVDIIVLFG